MGKDSGSAPAAPDPYATAAAQGEQDRKTLQYGLQNSRTSTVNPFGSTSWSNNKTFDQAGWDSAMAAYNTQLQNQNQTSSRSPGFGASSSMMRSMPGNAFGDMFGGSDSMSQNQPSAPDRANFEGVDNWVNTQTLSPESQGIYDTSTSKLGEAVGNMSTDANAYNQQVADALYSKMRTYQDPADAQARSSLQSNLADRGFQVGNEGFNSAMTNLGDIQQRGLTETSNNAVLAGQQAGQQQLSMQQQIANTLSNLRNQQVAGVSGMPTTTTTPSIQAPDLSGMVQSNYANAMNQYNAQQSSNDSALSGILGLAGTIGGAYLGGPSGAAAGGKLASFFK